MHDSGVPIPRPGDDGYPESANLDLPGSRLLKACILCGGTEMRWDQVVPQLATSDRFLRFESLSARTYTTATCAACGHVLWFSF